jgi:hypothetical protein
MPQYRSAARQEADALEEKGNVEARASQRNVQRADHYALAVVLFATSLFFAGISGRLSDERSRGALLVMGCVTFVGTVVWMATFPVIV